MKKLLDLVLSVVLVSLATLPLSCRRELQPPAGSITREQTSDAIVAAKLAITGVSSPATGSTVANLIDGKLSTIWAGNNDPAVYLPNPNSQYVTIRLDTAKMKIISAVKIAFYTGGNSTIRYTFDVLVSQDGRTGWVAVLSGKQSAANNTALQHFTFAETKGRYVRIVGHGNNTTNSKANTWSEVEVYGAQAPTTQPTKLSIAGSQVTASHTVSPYVPANTVDGNLNTYWTSKMSAPEDYKSLTVNLGSLRKVDEVKISFYTGADPKRVSRFGVFLSQDGTNWTKVISNTYSSAREFGNKPGSFDFPDALAKFVRIFCYGHTGTYSAKEINSINEVEVWTVPQSALPSNCKITWTKEPVGTYYPDDPGAPMPSYRTSTYYRNASGRLDSVYTLHQAGTPYYDERFYFTYNSSQQLIRYTEYEPSTRAISEKVFVYQEGRIIRDTTNYVDMGSWTYVTSYAYDAQGRISQRTQRDLYTPDGNNQTRTTNFNYDVNGNLIRTNNFGDGRGLVAVQYDDQVNFLRTDPILMFLNADYSRNNPRGATSYNPYGLPLKFDQARVQGLNSTTGRFPVEIRYSCN